MSRAKNTVVVVTYINKIIILSCFVLVFASPNIVSAAQPVIFNPANEQSAPAPLLEFIAGLEEFQEKDVVIARTDLNNDDIYEFIIRNTHCTPAKGCTYLIIADSDEDYVIIGKFTGRNISISGQQTHGIRDILVYNQTLNHYAHTTLKWDMERMHYSFNEQQAG